MTLKLAPGLALYIGPYVTTQAHSHHALEIVLGFSAPFSLADVTGHAEEVCKLAVVLPDMVHALTGHAGEQAFLYLDAEHPWARPLTAQLRSVGRNIIPYDHTTFAAEIAAVEHVQAHTPAAVWTAAVANLVGHLASAAPGQKFREEAPEPRIAAALTYIQRHLHQPRISLAAAADVACLSEGRFAHVFKEQVGIPLRRYVLWQRLQAAVETIATGDNLTQAAYQAGFADSAHLSRVFREMFGVAPSAVLKR